MSVWVLGSGWWGAHTGNAVALPFLFWMGGGSGGLCSSAWERSGEWAVSELTLRRQGCDGGSWVAGCLVGLRGFRKMRKPARWKRAVPTDEKARDGGKAGRSPGRLGERKLVGFAYGWSVWLSGAVIGDGDVATPWAGVRLGGGGRRRQRHFMPGVWSLPVLCLLRSGKNFAPH